MGIDINIKALSINETFNMFITEYEEDDKELVNKVIYGTRIRFSLFDYIRGRKNIMEKSKSGKVSINGRTYRMIDFDMELVEREKLMKEYLIDKMGDRPIAKARI